MRDGSCKNPFRSLSNVFGLSNNCPKMPRAPMRVQIIPKWNLRNKPSEDSQCHQRPNDSVAKYGLVSCAWCTRKGTSMQSLWWAFKNQPLDPACRDAIRDGNCRCGRASYHVRIQSTVLGLAIGIQILKITVLLRRAPFGLSCLSIYFKPLESGWSPVPDSIWV